MKLEELYKIIIKEILSIEIGATIPSINGLAAKHECSRGNVQKCIAKLEQTECIKLEKTNQGTQLLAINPNQLRVQLFNRKISIALPSNWIENENNLKLLFDIRDQFNYDNSYLYTLFLNSTSDRYQMINQDFAELSVVTNTYFDLINDESLDIVSTINIDNSEKLTYVFSNLNNKIQIEEFNIHQSVNYANDNNHTIKLLTPDSYVVMCKKDISKLFKETDN